MSFADFKKKIAEEYTPTDSFADFKQRQESTGDINYTPISELPSKLPSKTSSGRSGLFSFKEPKRDITITQPSLQTKTTTPKIMAPRKVEIRYPFGTKKDTFTMPSVAEGLGQMAVNMGARLLEWGPKAVAQTVQNFRTIVKGEEAPPLELPFNPERLGFKGPIESTGRRVVDNFNNKLKESETKTEKDVWKAASMSVLEEVIPDILDVVAAGDLVTLGTRGFLKFSKFDPVLRSSFTKIGVNPDAAYAGRLMETELRNSVRKTGQEVIKRGNPKEMQEWFNAVGTIVERLAPAAGERVVPKITSQLIQNTQKVANKLIQDINKAPTRPLALIRKELPGEAFVKKPRFAPGLTIQPRKKVGYAKIADRKISPELEPLAKEATAPSAQKIMGKKPSPFITRKARETTLLKDKIKGIQKEARLKSWSKAKLNRELEKARLTKETKIRTEQLKTLKTGITERIKGINKGIRRGTITKREDILKAGNELKAKLKELQVDPTDAKWFTDTFKNLEGVDDLAKKLPEITARVDRLVNAREVRNLKKDILEELKTAKPKIGQKKALESKFGPEAQKKLDFIRNNIKGNRTIALAKIEENINKYGTTVDGVTQEVPPKIAKQNALLNMVGIKKMSLGDLKATLKNIQSLKTKGELSTLTKQFNKTSELEQIKDIAIKEFKPKKGAAKILGEAERKINPIERVWHTIDNALLGIRNISEKLTFSKEFKVADWVGEKIRVSRNNHNRLGIEWNNAKVRAFKNTFGEKNLGKIYRELNKEQTVFKGLDKLGKEVEIKLTQLEAAYWHALTKDPTNLPMFISNMNFTPEMFKALDKFVDPKVKKYVDSLQEHWLKTIRKKVNKRYKTKFGMDMPDNPNHMPRLYSDKTPEEDITNLLFGDAFPSHPSTVPSGVKTRIGSKAEFKRISIESALRRHSEQMNQFVNFDETISDLRRVFSDPAVKETILSQKGGSQLYKTLNKKIDDIARGGMAAQMKLAALDYFIGNFTKASLMFNWVPFVKQTTSFPAFTLGRGSVSYPQLIRGSFSFHRNPVKWTKMFAESDFIFERLTQGFNRETALAFRRGDKDFTIKELDMTLGKFLKDATITPTRGGDMIPILPGLTAKYNQVVKSLKGKGLSKEEIHKRALAEAEVLASRTQQSRNIEDLGRIQTANSVGKGISMYSTTPIQYHRETIGTIRRLNRGQGSFKEMLRAIITGWIVLPQLFQWVSDGGEWNEERQLRALLLGPWNYYPAAGNMMGTMYDAFTKGETWKNVSSGISPLFSIPLDIQSSWVYLGKIMFKDGDVNDWKRFAEKLYTTIALSSGKLPSTLPRTIKGVGDLLEEETTDIRRLFFSEYSLDKPKKKKSPKYLEKIWGTGTKSEGKSLKEIWGTP